MRRMEQFSSKILEEEKLEACAGGAHLDRDRMSQTELEFSRAHQLAWEENISCANLTNEGKKILESHLMTMSTQR